MEQSLKRPRRTSTSSSASSSSSTASSSSFSPKLFRHSTPPTDSSYTCSLPPTCSDSPQHFSTSSLYQQHYLTFHSHVCKAPPSPYPFAQPKSQVTEKGKEKETKDEEDEVCGRIFPDERLLELHLKECHDPITQLKQQRGEKTFECLQSSSPSPSLNCTQKFSTPKTRRLHMISVHGYPKEWFFGVTVWGIEHVLNKGGGMVRRDWKPRPGQAHYEEGQGQGVTKVEEKVEGKDEGMDELTKKLEGSSIGFVPRAVSRRQQHGKTRMSTEPTV